MAVVGRLSAGALKRVLSQACPGALASLVSGCVATTVVTVSWPATELCWSAAIPAEPGVQAQLPRRGLHRSASLLHGQRASEAEAGSVQRSDEAFKAIEDARWNEVQDILQHLKVQPFHEQLDSLAAEKVAVPVQEFVDLTKRSGATASEEEAQDLIHAMHKAGLILRFRSQIYLHPKQISSTILRSMPDTEKEIEAIVEDLEAELQPLEHRRQEIEAAATRRVQMLMYGGLLFSVVHCAAFIRLTYWELSWDVMEPLAYFSAQFGFILAYIYYIMTRKEFNLQSYFEHLTDQRMELESANTGFDRQRYHRLVQDLTRFRRLLASYKKKQADVCEGAEQAQS